MYPEECLPSRRLAALKGLLLGQDTQDLSFLFIFSFFGVSLFGVSTIAGSSSAVLLLRPMGPSNFLLQGVELGEGLD